MPTVGRRHGDVDLFFLSYLAVLVVMSWFGSILALPFKYYQSLETLVHCEVATTLHSNMLRIKPDKPTVCACASALICASRITIAKRSGTQSTAKADGCVISFNYKAKMTKRTVWATVHRGCHNMLLSSSDNQCCFPKTFLSSPLLPHRNFWQITLSFWSMKEEIDWIFTALTEATVSCLPNVTLSATVVTLLF